MDVEIYPAFIRDNPVMQGAFASFMNWIWRQDEAHVAYCQATGAAPIATSRDPLAQMIDKATGYATIYADGFAKWAIETRWGVEGRDDQDEATPSKEPSQ